MGEKQKPPIVVELSKKEVCALFDLQFMLTQEVWDTLEINGMKETMTEFFKRIEEIDDNMIHEADESRLNREKLLKEKREIEFALDTAPDPGMFTRQAALDRIEEIEKLLEN